jgi:hypothetical protein
MPCKGETLLTVGEAQRNLREKCKQQNRVKQNAEKE